MVCIMGMIFFLSHQPYDSIQFPQFIGTDKSLHIIAYGILAGAFLYGLHPFVDDSNRGVTAIVVVLFCLLFGISDEFHQSFIAGRYVSFWDVVADGLGALLIVGWWMRREGKSKA